MTMVLPSAPVAHPPPKAGETTTFEQQCGESSGPIHGRPSRCQVMPGGSGSANGRSKIIAATVAYSLAEADSL
jgi:hypothetical protein